MEDIGLAKLRIKEMEFVLEMPYDNGVKVEPVNWLGVEAINVLEQLIYEGCEAGVK
jgi:hypothetical protein